MSAPRSGRVPQGLVEFFGTPAFTAAIALLTLISAFGAYAIRGIIGWPGLIGVVGILLILAIASLIAQRNIIEWRGALPLTVMLFVGWSIVSFTWSAYQTATLGGVLYQLIFTFFGIYVALVRDTIQIVRVVGDALRILLTVSLALEILSGIILNIPFTFLSIQGNIAYGGPIQGLFGSRNQLSIVALIAFVTFLIEMRTRSVPRGRAWYSIILAAVCLGFTHSPVIAAVSVFVGLATFALFLVRKIPEPRRNFAQWVLAAITLVLAVNSLVFRSGVITLLNARTDFQVRYQLWVQLWYLIRMEQPFGWGWVGPWPTEMFPFTAILSSVKAYHSNALNAYLDVYFQLGFIGLALFVMLIVATFARSWILGSNRRSVVYAWAPLVLVALIVTSVFESTILVESGWMILVICAVKAAQGVGWPNLPKSHDGVLATQAE